MHRKVEPQKVVKVLPIIPLNIKVFTLPVKLLPKDLITAFTYRVDK